MSYIYIVRWQLICLCLFFFSFTKDFWVFYGINTELFQYAAEFQAKVPVSIPWSFDAVINDKERKYEVDFPACTKDVDFFSVRYVLFRLSASGPQMVILLFFSFFSFHE